MKIASVFAVIFSVALAQSGYQFAADTELFLSSPLQTSFSCEGLPYGYYADVDNNCEVFHVCLPIQDEVGNTLETAQYSFICGNQTVFSQDSLTCAHPEEAVPCAEARSLYDVVNAEFGRVLDEKK